MLDIEFNSIDILLIGALLAGNIVGLIIVLLRRYYKKRQNR